MNMFKKKTMSSFFGLDSSTDESYEEYENSFKEPEAFAREADREQTDFQQHQSEDIDIDTSVLPSSNQYTNKKVVEINSYQATPERTRQPENKRVSRKITVYEPRAYADCKSIAQALFRKEVVILTFSAMEELQARRVVDFITGAVYAVDGDIQRIGEEIFICTPANVEVDSSIAQSLIATHLAEY